MQAHPPRRKKASEAMIHELKTWPVAFELALSGAKMFEIRINDRAFQVGDTLRLREYELETDHYTGRELLREVTCVVFGWGLPDGVCALGLKDATLRTQAGAGGMTFEEWEATPEGQDAIRELNHGIKRAALIMTYEAGQANAPQADSIRANPRSLALEIYKATHLSQRNDSYSEYTKNQFCDLIAPIISDWLASLERWITQDDAPQADVGAVVEEAEKAVDALGWALEEIPDECNCEAHYEADTNAWIHDENKPCRIFTYSGIEATRDNLRSVLAALKGGINV